VLVSSLVFTAVTVLSYGDPVRFFQHPARTAMIVVTLALTVASLFAGSSGLSSGVKEDRRNRWIFIPVAVLSVVLVWFPPFADARDWLTLDDQVTPYIGLALFVVGGILRIVPVFVLGRRFSGLVAIQPGHRLQTSGLYGLIRHPSYAGLVIMIAGYVLVFRCWLGLLGVAALLAVLVVRINAEEAMLASEFGDDYAAYRRRTWRLLPWIY
jgi:protein-S-isoprenylcysteine O-methyltransferase Ste14